MKKTVIALLLAGLLAGCGTTTSTTGQDSSSKGSTSQSSSSSNSSSSVASTSESTGSSSSSTSSSSAAASSSTSSSASSAVSVTPAATTSQYSTLVSELTGKLGSIWLPAAISTTDTAINATTADDAGVVKINFFTSSAAVPLNDSSLRLAVPAYSLTKQTYTDNNTAVSTLNWLATDNGLPTVDLGDNQTATKETAAGVTYIHWNEGNWSITVRGSHVADTPQDPTAVAKQLVALFKSKSLPAPSNKGAADFNVSDGDGNQTITWNSGASVYKLSGSNALATAKTGVK